MLRASSAADCGGLTGRGSSHTIGKSADAETWITVGVNHYIESWHAMIYLNYIMKMEQDDWGAPESIDNDLIVLQFQVAP